MEKTNYLTQIINIMNNNECYELEHLRHKLSALAQEMEVLKLSVLDNAKWVYKSNNFANNHRLIRNRGIIIKSG